MTKVNLGKDTSGRPLVLDDTTLAKIRWAEAKLGWTFAIIQGSYMAGIGAAKSGGTHDKAGAVDLRTWDIPKSIGITAALTALRQAGLIAWYRPQSAFPDHEIHALDYGNPALSTAAKNQVTAYLAGRNGLSGSLSGPDDGPKVTIPKEVPVLAARIDGVDISHWQSGSLDFVAAKKAGVRWVYHKTSEGAKVVDASYSARVAQIRAAGLPPGAYHFARPSESSGKSQAQRFLSLANVQPGDMRPMLDLEDAGGLSRAALTAWVGEFVAEVVKALGVPPFIYTPFSLDQTFDCPLWVARYSNAMAPPVIPAPWKSYTVWQYSNGVYGVPHSVAGLGAVDLNTMNGDPAHLTTAFRIGTKPTPTEDDMPLSDADIAKVAAAVAKIPVQNKDASGVLENTGTLAGMVSRLDIANNQNTAQLAALGTKLDQLATLLQAAIDSGKS